MPPEPHLASVESRSIPAAVLVHKPRPRLRLATEAVAIEASPGADAQLFTGDLVPVLSLSFDYGNVSVRSDDPAPHVLHITADGMAAIERDQDAELRARCLLEGFGAVELAALPDRAVSPDSEADYLLHVEGDVHDTCAFGAWVVPQLRALGWTIEVDETYPYRVVEGTPTWWARVTQDEEKPNWFDLQLGVELEGRTVNLLPALVGLLDTSGGTLSRLARRTRAVAVALPDGRYLALPAERARSILRVLTELYDGSRVEPDVLHLTPLLAGALHRLDEALDGTAEGGAPLRWTDPTQLRAKGRAFVESKPPEIEAERPAGLQATLRYYQRDGVQWLQHLRRHDVGGVLADDMGLGKTLQCIAHICLEKAAGRLTRPALVVGPTSLVGNWEREIEKFAPFLKVLRLTGAKRHGRYDDIRKADVVVTSYPILVRDGEKLASHRFHLLVLDEAHIIKNTRSQAHRAAKQLDADHRVCVTGTPVENHLGELWALFDFLQPGLLGDELGFRRWYRVPIEKEGDEERMASLRQMVGPYMLRRLKSEVEKELPPKTELFRPVVLSGKQRELYESIRVAAHGEVRKLINKKGLSASTIPILDALTKLRQVCCDPRLVPMRAARGLGASAKTEALFELTTNQLARGHRILIFSQFTRMLDLIARGLTERGVDYLSLTGSTRDRQKQVDAFENGEADVFLISLKAGGVGLTLTSADTVIHYDPWWNPAAQDQATDRAYRLGQTKPVVAHNLFVAGSVEERMLALQRRKRKLAHGLLAGGAVKAAWTEDEIEELFAPLG